MPIDGFSLPIQPLSRVQVSQLLEVLRLFQVSVCQKLFLNGQCSFLQRLSLSKLPAVLIKPRPVIQADGNILVLRAGSSRLSRQGPPPDPGVSGSIGTLSELVADFAGQLAPVLKETTSPP